MKTETKNNEKYNFDLILTEEELKANQKRVLEKEKQTKKVYHLKKWVKVTLLLILGAFIGITIYQLFTIKTTHYTPVGSYTCHGGIIGVCTAENSVVYKYIAE